MNKIFLLFVFLTGTIITLHAQELPPIQTDRPDQTECPFIVPKNHWQFESGFTFEKVDQNNKTYQYPTLLSKYGVNDKFELRLITELAGYTVFSKQYSGVTPITVGFKTKLTEEKGIVPEMSFIGHIGIPGFASKAFKTDYFVPSFRFVMQHTLSDKSSLSYNLGAEWDGFSAEPTFIYTLTTGYSFTDKLGGYIELYGFAPQKSIPDHRFDGGLTYLIKRNIMIDISGGFGISDIAPDYYAALGFSFRLKN